MATELSRPGVYLEEGTFVDSTIASPVSSTALFLGIATKGSTTAPVRCESWSDYVANFGGFDVVYNSESTPVGHKSYLPYAVYSYFQNGGRPCYVQRVVDSATPGVSAFKAVSASSGSAFTLTAKTPGTDGNNIGYTISKISSLVNGSSKDFFTVNIYYNSNLVESFFNLTLDGAYGTSKLDTTINDAYTGSKYVSLSAFDPAKAPTVVSSETKLTGGTNPALKVSGSTNPYVADYSVATPIAVAAITGPVLLNLTSFESIEATPKYYVPNTNSVSGLAAIKDRGNVFIINDSVPARAGGAVADYITTYVTNSGSTGLNSSGTAGDSYVASYTPWIIVPDPSPSGSTIAIPPGGAIAGVMTRIDTTNGVFRAPAGIIASITNAVGVETKFTETQLGAINASNVNVIRPVTGAGISVMGARTRKIYGPDKYVSGRRTLIYVKERLRQSTQFAIFENNDQRLWLSLISAAEQILRPLWEQGGLKGNSPQEAYYIKCDSSINTPALVQAGEVRLDVGIALQYPAEFIVIRVTQYETGGYTAEVQTSN